MAFDISFKTCEDVAAAHLMYALLFYGSFKMAYTRCKNCDNNTPGTKLYSCRNCGKVYCEECIPKNECGNCDKEWFPTFVSMLPFASDNLKALGEVDSDDEQGDDD